MTNEPTQIQRLEAEVAALKSALDSVLIKLAATHNLALALAYQCNSPVVLAQNFEEIAEGNNARMLNSLATEAQLAELASIHEAVRKQLPAARK